MDGTHFRINQKFVKITKKLYTGTLMLRFAFNPAGDMNIGDLRVALLNHIVSKQRGEDLIVRIEDTDKERVVEGKDEEMLGILALFDIKYTQVIHQSQNFRFYSAMALQLLHEAKAFNCFCSYEWLDKKQEEAKNSNKAYRYDDACRDLPAELIIDNENPFTVRIKRPSEAMIIQDRIKGEISFEPEEMESFVILKQDKTPTSDFASAVDDMLNDISIVIRSEDSIESTPKQENVRRSLGYNKQIEFAHIPMISNQNEFSVKALLEDGYLPEAIANCLILTAGKTPKEIFTIQEVTEWLDLANISNSPERFDIEMLKHINREHLRNLEAKELSRYVGFADDEIGALAKLYLQEVSTTKELKSRISAIFSKKEFPDELKETGAKLLGTIKGAPHCESYDDFKGYLMKESGLKGEELSKPLRILLTGAEHGPDIDDIYKHIKNYIGEIAK